jgi:hypothetical protein
MKTLKLLVSLFLLVTFWSCQKEVSEVIDETQTPENLTGNVPLSNLLLRTSQNPTEVDNILDNNSCYRVQLPVTIYLNGISLTVNTESDYQTVKNIKNAYTTDNDIVYYTYPITIKYKNYTSQTITSYSQLHSTNLSCSSDDGLNEIDCIAINYPISINLYNTNNQVTSTVTLQSNLQLFGFLNTQTSGTIAAIAFPISITNAMGQNIVINNNTQLETLIENSIDDCDDDLIPSPSFVSVLTSGTWRVTYYYDDDNGDETYLYNGCNFTFNSGGTLSVLKNAVTTNGTWNNYIDSGENKLALTFEGTYFEEIEEDYKIIEYSATVIKLKHVSGGNGGTDYLTFTKN